MCLVAFAFGVSKDYPLIFATNRDELHRKANFRGQVVGRS
ncbi:MAG: NRDE family protein [Candidatus Rariloculaceae bacterium]